jgi:uncharacterized protein
VYVDGEPNTFNCTPFAGRYPHDTRPSIGRNRGYGAIERPVRKCLAQGIFTVNSKRRILGIHTMSQPRESSAGVEADSVEERFFADAMLGKLARWLRVLGCDTGYRKRHMPGDLERAVAGGRVPLTRDRKLATAVKGSVFIRSDHVGDQLKQVSLLFPIAARPRNWFTLCIECNTRLEIASQEEIKDKVPDYVFQTNPGPFKRCPSCGRCFWPGSHRKRMLERLGIWKIDRLPPLC